MGRWSIIGHDSDGKPIREKDIPELGKPGSTWMHPVSKDQLRADRRIAERQLRKAQAEAAKAAQKAADKARYKEEQKRLKKEAEEKRKLEKERAKNAEKGRQRF